MPTIPLFATKYSPPVCSVSIDFRHAEDKCDPSFRESCDINFIMRRAVSGMGMPAPMSGTSPAFGDFSGISSYHELVNRKLEIDSYFMSLPSAVRERFSNNVEVFLSQAYNDPDFGSILFPQPSPVADSAPSPVTDVSPSSPATV